MPDLILSDITRERNRLKTLADFGPRLWRIEQILWVLEVQKWLQYYLDDVEVRSMVWPAGSPSLNAIENL